MSKVETRRPDIGHDIRNLRDDEVDAVNGGTKRTGSWFEVLAKALGDAADRQVQKMM